MLLAVCLLFVSSGWAQSQRFQVTIENVGPELPVLKKGIFNTPVGATDPGPIGPDGSYEFSFTAASGTYLSFALNVHPVERLVLHVPRCWFSAF